MGKQRAIRIFLNRTFEEKSFPTDQNKVKYEKANETQFEPACVLSEKKSRWRFWRGARQLILFVDGAFYALKFSKVTKQMQPFWTQKEATKFANKSIRKALEEHKPMKWSQFFILLAVQVIILIVLVAIAQRFGVF